MNTLKSTLARIGSLDTYLRDPRLKALVGRLGTLPSLPSLYVEVMKELAKEEPAVERISSIIARDPGMTARILQIVNSAVLGLPRKISSPFEAVQYLGFGTVRSLVLSAHIFSQFQQGGFKSFPIQQLWDHAMSTATVAGMIMRMEQAGLAEAEEAYVAGMLHDVGQLMLANSLPEQFQQAVALAARQGIPLHEAELQIYGATHAAAAAYLLGLWGLPATIVEAVAFHHTPLRSDVRLFSPLTAVHAANVLEHEFSTRLTFGRPSVFDTAYLESIGLQDRLAAWRDEVSRLR